MRSKPTRSSEITKTWNLPFWNLTFHPVDESNRVRKANEYVMNCGRLGKLLVDYSEGELAGGKRLAVERHLSRCEHCRRELSEIEQLKKSIQSLEAPRRDVAFWSEFNRRLSQRLADKGKTAADYRLSWRPGYTLAAGAATVLLIVWLAVIWLVALPGSSQHREVTVTLARETGRLETSESGAFEPEPLGPLGYSGAIPVLADLSSEEMDQLAEDMLVLVEDTWEPVPEDVVLDGIYEHTVYDLIEDLSAEEFEELYEELESA